MTTELYEIDAKAFAGEELSRDQLEVAQRLATAAQTDDAVMANGILFLAGDQTQKRTASERLLAICRRISDMEASAQALLLRIMEHFPAREIRDNRCYRDFVLSASRSQHFATRGNAIRVMRRLAEIGDRNAVELLRQATKDPHATVKRAAEIALDRLSQSGQI